MLVTSSTATKKGATALAHLKSADAKRKGIVSSCAEIPAGEISFTDEICGVPYTDRDGNAAEYDAIIVKAGNKKYTVALSALREKEPILVEGKAINCPNFGEFDTSLEDLFNKVSGKKCELHRVKGFRKSLKNGSLYRGRFEYFDNLH